MDLLVRNTDDVEFKFRLDYWMGAITEALFCCSSSTSEPTNFSCRMTGSTLDDLYIIQTQGSPRSTFRTRKAVADADEHAFYLLGDAHHSVAIEWRGSPVKLEPGDLFFGDSRHVHAARGLTTSAYIKIPARWAYSWLRDPERLAGRRIACGTGWGMTLSNYVAQLKPDVAVAAPVSRKQLADNLGALLALVESEQLQTRTTRTSRRRQLVRSIRDCIRERAGEHGLSAFDVATSLRISERTLHDALIDVGESFHAILLQCRVDLARRMLDANHLARITTAEIGRRAGFADPSYFVRAASPLLGQTPARYRASRKNCLE